MKEFIVRGQLMSLLARIKQPVLNSCFYFGSSIIGLFLSVITTPVFSQHFSYEDFAIFNYFNNFAGFFSFFFSLEFMSYYAAEYFRNNETQNKELISSIAVFLVAWNAICIVAIWQLATFIFGRIGLQFPTQPFLLLALVTVGSSVFKGLWLIQYRLKGEGLKYFLISAASKIFTVVVGLLFVIYFTRESAAGARMTGIMIVEFIIGVLALIYFIRQGHSGFNLKRIKEGLRFILPILMGSVIHYLIISSDQFFLERKSDIKDIALYSLGLNFASYLYFFNYSIFQALEPQVLQYAIQGQFSKLKKTSAVLIGIALFSTIGFTLISKYVIAFLTKDKYTEAYEFANILVFSYLFFIVFSLVTTIMIAIKRTRAIFLINLAGGIFSVAVFYVASTYFGVKAVAYSKILIFVFVSGLGFMLIKHYLPKSVKLSNPG